VEDYEGASLEVLTERWPELKFVHFYGADDVDKYRKYTWASCSRRFITMGRPGFTEAVREGMAHAKVDSHAGFFVVGPELPDVSSTAARKALIARDAAALEGVLHPKATQWCLESEAFRAETQPSLVRPPCSGSHQVGSEVDPSADREGRPGHVASEVDSYSVVATSTVGGPVLAKDGTKPA